MTKADAGLSDIFVKSLKSVHWQKIETWSTGQGVPDLNGCSPSTWKDERGFEFWIECKKTAGSRLAHNLSPEQIGWIERRLRFGGRVFVAVRRLRPAGLRLGRALDELHLFHGSAVRGLAKAGIAGLGAPAPLGVWENGPARWNWAEIKALLTA